MEAVRYVLATIFSLLPRGADQPAVEVLLHLRLLELPGRHLGVVGEHLQLTRAQPVQAMLCKQVGQVVTLMGMYRAGMPRRQMRSACLLVVLQAVYLLT